MTKRSNLVQAAPDKINGHQRRRHETRQALLSASRRLFVERGVEQVAIDAITSAAGVAKGSFYNHFDSREALFEEVLSSTLGKVLDTYLNFSPGIEDPLQLAIAKSNFGLRTLLADPDTCRLLLQAGPATPGGAIDRGLRFTLGKELKEAVTLGGLSHLDPELVYAAYFGVITQTIGRLLEQGDDLDPDLAAPQVTQLCFAVLGLPGNQGGDQHNV